MVPHLKKMAWWQRHAKRWERRLFLDSVHWQITSTNQNTYKMTCDSKINLFVFVCVQWCPTHIVLCFCFVVLRLGYPMLPVCLGYLMLPVSLDCQFWLPRRCSLICSTCNMRLSVWTSSNPGNTSFILVAYVWSVVLMDSVIHASRI
jgi:hypothetical protein